MTFSGIDDIEGVDEEVLRDIKEKVANGNRFNMSNKIEEVVGKSDSEELKEQKSVSLKEIVGVQEVMRKSTYIDDSDVDGAVKDLVKRNRMRSDGGNTDLGDILTTFIYLLLRDHMTAGKLEAVVNEIASGTTIAIFANGFLEEYADKLANTLKNTKVNALAKALEGAFEGKSLPWSEKMKRKAAGEVHLDTDEEALRKLESVVEEAVVSADNVIDEYEEGPSRDLNFRKKNEQLGDSSESIQVNPLNALEEIKKLVPTDNVKQIADILKSEVERVLEAEAKTETREAILEKRAEVNKEHTATNEDAKKMAEEFVKDAVDEAMMTTETPDDDSDVPVSRGKLADVVAGKAFPEALDGVFGDNPQEDLEKAKKIGAAMEELRSDPDSIFRRVDQ